MTEEEHFQINQLLDEARERASNAVRDHDLIELVDSVGCLIEILDRMNPKP